MDTVDNQQTQRQLLYYKMRRDQVQGGAERAGQTIPQVEGSVYLVLE